MSTNRSVPRPPPSNRRHASVRPSVRAHTAPWLMRWTSCISPSDRFTCWTKLGMRSNLRRSRWGSGTRRCRPSSRRTGTGISMPRTAGTSGFTPSGAQYIAAVVADRIELEDEYASLIKTFGAAALAALLLVAGGGYILVRKSTAPIERSMEQMRRFMADAAHELRTPITLLRTRADVAVGQTRDPTRDTTTFHAIEREAGRLGAIVGELLLLARADAGERPVKHEVLYLDDAAAGAVEAARTLAEHKRVALEVGTFEEARITGDPALVRELLLIVLDNAIKFTPAGGRVRLDVSVQDGRAALVVTDTGIGIPVDQLPHVFERFYRGDAARSQAEGAGLGLAIARWIAEMHGARIDIASEPGVGTRVTLGLPLAL